VLHSHCAVRDKMLDALQTGYWQTKPHIGWMLI
jgi:hypothetical protein